MVGPKKYYPDIKQSIGLLLVIFGISTGATFLQKVIFDEALHTLNALYRNSLELCVYVITFLIAIRVGAKRKAQSTRSRFSFSFNKTPLTDILLLLVATICIGILIEPVINFIPVPDVFREAFDKLEDIMESPSLALLSLVIAPAIVEEIIHRGIILDGFLRNYHPHNAILASALLFGLFHLNPWQFIAGLFLGLIIGWTYWKTGSLLICMLMHAINNLVVLFQYWTFGDSEESISEMMGQLSYIVFYVIILIVFTSCAVMLRLHFRDREKPFNGLRL